MGASGPEEFRGRLPRLRVRDLAAWLLGVATSILVNLVSGNTAVALRVSLAALAIIGVLGATYLIQRLEATSTLRRFLPPVLLTVVSPLILLSVLGTWGGYLMFLAAALVAVAVSSKGGGLRGAFVTLGGMAAIAACPVTVAVGLGVLSSDPFTGTVTVICGFLEIVVGLALLMRGERLLWLIDERLARMFLFVGIIGAAYGVAGLRAALFSPAVAAAALPLTGLVIADVGYCLLVLLTPERIERITARWRELTRPRGPDEQTPPYSQAVMRFLRHIGTVTPPEAGPPPVDPGQDSPTAPSVGTTQDTAGSSPSPTPKQSQ